MKPVGPKLIAAVAWRLLQEAIDDLNTLAGMRMLGKVTPEEWSDANERVLDRWLEHKAAKMEADLSALASLPPSHSCDAA